MLAFAALVICEQLSVTERRLFDAHLFAHGDRTGTSAFKKTTENMNQMQDTVYSIVSTLAESVVSTLIQVELHDMTMPAPVCRTLVQGFYVRLTSFSDHLTYLHAL